MCDALTANLEERQFFRIRTPASHAEVMTYLSLFAAAESFLMLCVTGEWLAGWVGPGCHSRQRRTRRGGDRCRRARSTVTERAWRRPRVWGSGAVFPWGESAPQRVAAAG